MYEKVYNLVIKMFPQIISCTEPHTENGEKAKDLVDAAICEFVPTKDHPEMRLSRYVIDDAVKGIDVNIVSELIGNRRFIPGIMVVMERLLDVYQYGPFWIYLLCRNESAEIGRRMRDRVMY